MSKMVLIAWSFGILFNVKTINGNEDGFLSMVSNEEDHFLSIVSKKDDHSCPLYQTFLYNSYISMILIA